MCNKCWYDIVDMTDIYIIISRCYNSNKEVYKYYGRKSFKKLGREKRVSYVINMEWEKIYFSKDNYERTS